MLAINYLLIMIPKSYQIDEIERRYQKQLLELATITAKANAAEKDRIEVQAKF